MNHCHERGNVRLKVGKEVVEEWGGGGGGGILSILFCRARRSGVVSTPVIRNKGNYTVPLKVFFPSFIPK